MLLAGDTLMLGAGLFGISALPASGEPSGSRQQTLDAGWKTMSVASVAEAQRRLDAEAGDDDGETLVLFPETVSEAEVDLPPTGDSPGDFFLFEEQLFTDRAGTQPAGSNAVRGELGLTTLAFDATFDLPGGKITVAGSQFPGEVLTTLAITGGTGEYLGAGGLFIAFGLPNGDTILLFRIVR